MSQASTARNRLGALTRHHPDDAVAIADARKALAEAKIAEYIQKVVDSAPPLTTEQRERLALLL